MSEPSSPKKTEDGDNSAELAKFRKDLDSEKMKYAELNGKYLEKADEFDKNKEKLSQCEKELSELKSRQAKYELLSKNVDELESCKKEIIKLQTENKKYKAISEEGSIAIEQLAGLQKQHEQLVKENSDLKAALFDAENTCLLYTSPSPRDS